MNTLWFGLLSALFCGMFFIYAAIRYDPEDRMLRLFHAGVVLYFAALYALVLAGTVPNEDLGPVWFRPALPLLYLLPIYDIIADRRKHK